MPSKTGRPASSRRLSNGGFSLIEIMLFVGMLVAIVYGSSHVLFQGSKQTAEDRNRWNATELGSMLMEELTFSYMSAGQLNQGTHRRHYDQAYAMTAANSPKKFYTAEWTVQENNPIQGVLQITLAVKWNEGSYEKNITFQTYR